MKKLVKILPVALFAAFPTVALAQFEGISGLVRASGGIVKQLIIVVAGIALLVFFWGLVKFISKAGDEGEVKKSKGLMLWGIVALFVMVSIWGIVYFIGDQILPGRGDDYYQAPPVPVFPSL